MEDEIRIPNRATYSPVALTDIFLVAPLASRLLLRATLPGRLVQAAALGLYAGSALRDWRSRAGARKIDFRGAFGADPRRLAPTPVEVRRREVEELVGRLNDEYEPVGLPRKELAILVNRRLTAYIARLTGQRVETSDEVRDFMLVRILFPSALGACDVFSGDIAIFRATGVFEPHILAHELAHRKGYWRELEAQVLGYLALIESGELPLRQAARCERLHRQLRTLAGGDPWLYHGLLDGAGLRPELDEDFRRVFPLPSAYDELVGGPVRRLYDARMKVTGQGGLRDYDAGFTDFLYAVESRTQSPGPAP